VFKKTDQKAAYVRQAGFDPIQQEQMVIKFIETHGSIKRADVVDLCKIGPFQATRLLNRLVKEEKIERRGKGKGTFYEHRS
jgi:ATP-dependent DNA helicase RecG